MGAERVWIGGSDVSVLKVKNNQGQWVDVPTIDPLPKIDEWLEDNVAQEAGYVLDSSLTMSNAAAPADKVGELKSAVDDTANNTRLLNDGLETFGLNYQFVYGYIYQGNVTSGIKYRLVSQEIMEYDRRISVTIKDGFKMGYYLYNADESFNAKVGDMTGTLVIPENTKFRAEIKRATEDTSEVADYTTFVSAVTFKAGLLNSIEEATNGMAEWLGYPVNLFSGVFTTTHSSNWKIEQDGNDVTFTHLTSYESGYPKTDTLSLSAGQYNFTADYNGGSNLLALYKGSGTYVKALSENDTITIEQNENYYIRIGFVPAQGNSVTASNIFIGAAGSGVIQELTEEVERIAPQVDILTSSSKADVLSISDTTDEFINPTTGITAAGSNYFHVVLYPVTEGKVYWVTASTRWGNAYFAWYTDDSLLSIGLLAPSELTAIQNYEVTAPTGANVLAVAYHTQSVSAKVTEIAKAYTRKWEGKKWVCVGDSLTAVNERTTKHYFDYVTEETGITTVNMGVSGSGYARMADSNQAFYQRISSCPTDADVVTIFGSFNDLGAGLPIGSVDDTGTDTLAGCINTTITNLQTVIPLVNLGIVAPTPWNTTQPATSGQAYNYVEILKAICERRSIPFLDLWRCSNLRPWDADFRTIAYSKDGGSGTHPDENGHKLIAPRFKGFLETLLL